MQRVERETTKSPATTGGRKKSSVRSNGQIAPTEPPPQPAGKQNFFYSTSVTNLLCSSHKLAQSSRKETIKTKIYGDITKLSIFALNVFVLEKARIAVDGHVIK